MTDKNLPEELLGQEIPTGILPEELETATDLFADMPSNSPMETDDELFDGSFDPDAFLPDDPEEPAETEVSPANTEEPDPEESSGSSEYMDHYPVLPDSVEKNPVEEPSVSEFDDGGEFDRYFDQKDTRKKRGGTNKERPTRKGRPKRRKGYGLLGIPHLLATVVWLLLILAIGVSLGRLVWVCAADVLAFGREEKIVTVSVTTNDTMESIAQKLQEAGLIRYPELFLFYADLTDAQEKITTGSFTLNTVYDYHALVNQMSPRSGTRAVVEDVLIPEGYNCRQIFALLEQRGICKAADLEKWAAEGELSDYWFLEGVERGSAYCLEGFLFPDTYDFYENSTPRAALEKMLDGFEYRINGEIRAKIPLLNQHLTDMMRRNGNDEEFIAANQFDIRDVVNVASLIEKETASNQESYRIASVIYNRLFNWGNSPRYLGIDATIIYALGGKTNLTAEDLAIDSPYNTRNHTGLPPGPIANPGLASIEAALNPETTSYYYYVLNPSTGVHDFSKTLAEHDKKVEKYLRGGNG